MLLKSYMSETLKTVVMHKGIDVLVFMIKNQNCDCMFTKYIYPSKCFKKSSDSRIMTRVLYFMKPKQDTERKFLTGSRI